MPSLDTNRSLTVLEVKDHLFKSLKRNAGAFEELKDKDKSFHDQSSNTFSNLSRKAGQWGTMLAQAGLVAGTALAGGLAASVRKAEEFNTQFRELNNLNLDKTQSEIEQLRKDVLDTAFETGRSTQQINKSFFDIQSGTGKFGDEVETATRKASDFARAYQVDFNTTVDAAVKAMRNFNIEADQLDQFFASQVKTVQTGIVTFEQLARVQTDYAGAANTAGQSIDSANKLFAVFSARAKSAEEAATLTKSAFTDLLKPATLEAFKKQGIEVFDKQTGKVKQLDEIVKQLNDRFAGMRDNDQAVTNLVNEFTGSEGLIALIGAAAKNGDQMMNTFEQFDATEFQLGKAMREAKMDTSEMADIARNRLHVVMSEIGQIVLPLWVEALGFVKDEILPGIRDRLPEIESFLKRMGGAMKETVQDIGSAINAVGDFIERDRRRVNINNPFRVEKNRAKIVEMGLGEDFAQSVTPESAYELSRAKKLREDDGSFNVENTKSLIEALSDNNDQAVELFVKNLRMGLFEQEVRGAGQKTDKAAQPDAGASPDATDKADKLSTQNAAARANAATTGALRGVTSDKAKTQNITVTIQRLIGIETFQTNNIEQAPERVEEQIREALIRSIRDAEVGISNS